MSNCGDEECMTEKTEAIEFAYLSGMTTGRLGERKRVIGILENVQTMFAESVTSPQKELMDGNLNQVAKYLLKEITGGKKMSENFELDSMVNMIMSVERAAKLRERLAILQICIEELKHAESQLVIDALDRVCASIEHRTHKGL